MAGIVPVTHVLDDIYTEDALDAQTERWIKLLAQFNTNYGHPAQFVSRSPGRVNIIGEHIDYSLYSVLPMAITADALLAVSTEIDEAASTDTTFKIRVSNVQAEKFPAHEFDIPFDTVEIDATKHEWTNYLKSGLKGALELLRKKHGAEFRPKSMEVLMDGSVPSGGGLSSSAAFTSASALAVMFANGEHSVDKTELTELAIISERAVGVNSGGMDQSASVFSIRDSALYVSFDPTLTARPVHFPKTEPELTFVIAQSFVAADKHVTGPVCYNLRVVECTLAAALLNAELDIYSPLMPDSGPLGVSLRGFQNAFFGSSDLNPEEQLTELIRLTKETLHQYSGYDRAYIAANILFKKFYRGQGWTSDEFQGLHDELVAELDKRYTSKFPVRAERFMLRQRALHVFNEALRVLKFMKILENPFTDEDGTTETFNKSLGALMNETQESCRDLYDCSCPELDQLCEIARRAGSYGSRLTGAGWGGCTVHLVPRDKVEAVKEAWEKEYYSKRELTKEQRESAVVVSKPGGGSAVFVVSGDGGIAPSTVRAKSVVGALRESESTVDGRSASSAADDSRWSNTSTAGSGAPLD